MFDHRATTKISGSHRPVTLSLRRAPLLHQLPVLIAPVWTLYLHKKHLSTHSITQTAFFPPRARPKSCLRTTGTNQWPSGQEANSLVRKNQPRSTQEHLVSDPKRAGTTFSKVAMSNTLYQHGSKPCWSSACPGPSEVCQWASGWAWEKFIWSWDQKIEMLCFNFHSPCLEEEGWGSSWGWGWGQEHRPNGEAWGGNIMLWGCFSATGTGQQPRPKDRRDGSWLGLPAWQWPETHRRSWRVRAGLQTRSAWRSSPTSQPQCVQSWSKTKGKVMTELLQDIS